MTSNEWDNKIIIQEALYHHMLLLLIFGFYENKGSYVIFYMLNLFDIFVKKYDKGELKNTSDFKILFYDDITLGSIYLFMSIGYLCIIQKWNRVTQDEIKTK